MNDTLLIEIGTEEVPAGYIVPALEAFRDSLLSAMEKQRISHGEARYFGTPRRLALMVDGVSERQKTEKATVYGPPASVGIDENGQFTLAAEKFAEKEGVALEDVSVTDHQKGRYLAVTKEEESRASAEIIEEILPDQILAMPFPKRMKWGDLDITFARPIISLTGLLGERFLRFSIGNIAASDHIFGHQFMYPEPYKITSVDQYERILESAGVVPDMDKRRKLLQEGVEKAARDYGCLVVPDEELVDTVTNLVEYPYPVVGKFDDEFLEVPDEVLITAMREHQKYFALKDENDRLRPYFIAVNNTLAKDMELVANGHERVLRARLADAKFFWEADLESSVDDLAEKLKKVTFQAELGTVWEKSRRTADLAVRIASAAAVDDRESLKEKVTRAAHICKADLVSQVVIEFTKLQGIMGRIYAEKSGEERDVADAVEQHYRPVHSGGALPANDTARILAIADKIDTICGCFSVGLIPTGHSDPYALRRQGLGILQIILDRGFAFPLRGLVDGGLDPFIKEDPERSQVLGKVMDFLEARLLNMLTERGFSKEAVNSALAVSFDNVPDVLLRVTALDDLRKRADFEPVSVAFKRVENILKKTGVESVEAVDPALFESDAEKDLYERCRSTSLEILTLTDTGDYDEALKKIADLRGDVDRFFDDVMVMVADERLKKNRIALLFQVSALFRNIADFSRI